MAKKSKRPPTRKQQQRRPQQRPAFPQRPLSSAPAADLTVDEVLEDEAAGDEDYATGSLPIPESDGPMPLPPPEAGEEEESVEAPAPAAAAASFSTGAPGRRRVGRIDPNAAAAAAVRPGQRQRGARSQSTAAMFEPLPPEDAAIPFDRVPYVPGDLRRVLIIAGLMVVLIVVANFVIGAIVK